MAHCVDMTEMVRSTETLHIHILQEPLQEPFLYRRPPSPAPSFVRSYAMPLQSWHMFRANVRCGAL